MRVYIVRHRRKPGHDDFLDEPDDILNEPKKTSPPFSTATALKRLGVDAETRGAYLQSQRNLKEAAKALRQALKTKNDAQIAAALETFQAATARDTEAWRKVQPYLTSARDITP